MIARFLMLCAIGFAPLSMAGEADVVDATIQAVSNTSFRVNATIRHGDTGWNHYADAFDVLDEQGKVLGTRILHHPHVDEQPFTRGLTLTIPEGVRRVTIRARDSLHEYGGKAFVLDVPR